MNHFRVTEIFKRKECCNKLSGHEWVEFGRSLGFEVRGLGHQSPRFRSPERAEAHKAGMERLMTGFVMPRSARELAKAARLGLSVE